MITLLPMGHCLGHPGLAETIHGHFRGGSLDTRKSGQESYER